MYTIKGKFSQYYYIVHVVIFGVNAYLIYEHICDWLSEAIISIKFDMIHSSEVVYMNPD